MLTAVAMFAVMDSLLKFMAGHYPPMQVACMRGLMSLPFVLAPVLWRRELHKLRMVNVRLHLLRGALAVGLLWGFIYAVAHSSITATYSIFMFAPLMIAGLAVPILGERIVPGQWGAILVGLVGVLIMLQPGSGQWTTMGIIAALVMLGCYAASILTLRLLSHTDTTESMVFSFSVLLTIGAALIALSDWQPLRASDWYLLLLLGLSGALGQHFVTEAFRWAPAAVVAPFEYTALLWGLMMDFVFWHVLPSTVTLLGGTIVIAAGLYLIHRERRAAAEPRH